LFHRHIISGKNKSVKYGKHLDTNHNIFYYIKIILKKQNTSMSKKNIFEEKKHILNISMKTEQI